MELQKTIESLEDVYQEIGYYDDPDDAWNALGTRTNLSQVLGFLKEVNTEQLDKHYKEMFDDIIRFYGFEEEHLKGNNNDLF